MTSAASSARTCKMRVLMAPHFYFLNLSIVVPADGIKAAKLRKRRLRYVTALWGSHQSSDCLTVSLGSWSADRESQYRVGKLAVFFAAGGGNRLRPSLSQSPVAQDGMKLPIRPSRVPLWVKTSQGAALLARQVYLSKRPCPVRGRVGGLGPSADIAVLLAIGAVL